MPRQNSHQIMLNVDHLILQAVEDWRRKQPIIPSRTAAFQHFIALGIRADHGVPAKRRERVLDEDTP